MNQYIVKGGIPLVGEVEISGAKNAALPILSAAIMSDETVTIENLPDVSDINIMIDTIRSLGAIVQRVDRHTVKINGNTIFRHHVDYEHIRKIRASYYLLGSLIGKYNDAIVPLPGGCSIGSRPIDQHLKGFQAMGVSTTMDMGNIIAGCDRLEGNHIFLDLISVGATINIMIAASMANGQTVIENAAKEPHVVDTANFLNSMGANIRGAGTDVIRINGVKRLHGCTYSVIPDMIEAGTYMLSSVVTNGDVTVKNVIPKHLEAISAKLMEIGCDIQYDDDSIRVLSNKRMNKTTIKTQPYPGFPTDMQPQMSATLALCDGVSFITESVFENRFKYVDELARMGANIFVEGNTAVINGVEHLSGTRVTAPDLRAGAALVLAALNADGYTIVDDIKYIQRGYENFDGKLRSLGACIDIVENENEIMTFKLKVG